MSWERDLVKVLHSFFSMVVIFWVEKMASGNLRQMPRWLCTQQCAKDLADLGEAA
jgi:hypothetical protein